MQYARLGASGLIVSRFALGCMTFGAKPDGKTILYKVDAAEASKIVACAVDHGINFFDTSDLYADGLSEIFLGQALKGLRQKSVVSTKVGFRVGNAITDAGLSRRHIHASIDNSLKRLGTDYVDVYLAHKYDPLTPLNETLQALDEVVRAGKARYLGFSNWPAWAAAIALERQRNEGWAPFITGQINYSLVQRDAEYELLPFMADAGVGAMAWSPLAGGLLTGKYNRDNVDEPNSRVAMSSLPYDRYKALEVVDALRAISSSRGTSVARVALAWLLGRPATAAAVIGVSGLEQLQALLVEPDFALADAEVGMLESATPLQPIYPHWHIDASQDDLAFASLGLAKPARIGGAARANISNKH